MLLSLGWPLLWYPFRPARCCGIVQGMAKAKKPNRETQISDALHNLIHGKLQATNAEIMLAVLGFAESDGYAEAMADQQFAAQCDVRARAAKAGQ